MPASAAKSAVVEVYAALPTCGLEWKDGTEIDGLSVLRLLAILYMSDCKPKNVSIHSSEAKMT